MQILYAKEWRRRASVSRLQTAVGFEAERLVLGCSTVLLAPACDPERFRLRATAAHNRMVALLAVAGRGYLAKSALLQLDAALDEWRRGDRGLAAIRLAFARLPQARRPVRDQGWEMGMGILGTKQPRLSANREPGEESEPGG